ncbi:MAG TPA: nucleotide exchange factor GrpE [Phycisphaerales bacterium]|nr:nucleotide exchange factor GrpE [Phycisphaerales bacterium]
MTTDQTNPDPHDSEFCEQDRILNAAAESEEMTRLREQLCQAQGDYQRVLADFSNYQRRALSNEQMAKTEGASRVAADVVTVIDHFDLALSQDFTKASTQSLVDGMKIVRDELVRTLGKHGVTLIAPKPNDLFTPGRHEAVTQQTADGVEPGRVVSTFQPGYAIATATGGERVIRPAKVSVAPTP